ncbi:MAG: GAF domain-containing protein [Thermodesulfobacteriota bacterium]
MAGSLAPDVQIQSLIDLVSNTTEAYTTALFLAPAKGQDLHLYAYQSLSRNLDEDVTIRPGDGLIGWVHKNNEPVNVDQFDRDTRRLLFYKTDEAIKSFMAVPLPKANGVLAVDSKQRYVFTEKSHKILWQFGQVIELALERVGQSQKGRHMGAAMDFLAELEAILSRRLQEGGNMQQAVALYREYTGAAAGFLAAILPGHPDHFYLMAQDSAVDLDLGQTRHPLDTGLAGWVMQNQKPLVLRRDRTGAERSFIFHPNEPLKELPYFAGFPVSWGGRVRGAVLLAGAEPFNFSEAQARVLEIATDRLAISVEMELLYERVAEISKLDPQVGLPHRTYFTERLNRLIKLSAVQGESVALLLVRFTNLDEVAREHGQEAAQDLLKAAGRYLLDGCPEDSELGLITYGLIGAALTGQTAAEAMKSYDDLLTRLSARPLDTSVGRLRVRFETLAVGFPEDGDRAEDLIILGLEELDRGGGSREES